MIIDNGVIKIMVDDINGKKLLQMYKEQEQFLALLEFLEKSKNVKPKKSKNKKTKKSK